MFAKLKQRFCRHQEWTQDSEEKSVTYADGSILYRRRRLPRRCVRCGYSEAINHSPTPAAERR